MKVLVTGASGQLGADVIRCCEAAGDEVTGLAHAQLDVADRDAVHAAVFGLAPDVIYHCGAWTAVDACESDPDRAFAVNAYGPRNVAEAAGRVGAHVVAVSTDYVFDGAKPTPYVEWDATSPMSVYGRSKLGGEHEVAAHSPTCAIVRTSWVFGKRGSDLVSWAFGAYERGELTGVLADQVSVPTYAPDLAAALAQFAVTRTQGLFHITSGSEAATRHELITAALRARGLDADGVAPIEHLDTERPAARPVYSVLDNRALRLAGASALRPWRDAIAEYVKDWDALEETQ